MSIEYEEIASTPVRLTPTFGTSKNSLAVDH